MMITYDMSTGFMVSDSEQGDDTFDARDELYQAEHNLQLLPVAQTETETTDPHPAVIAAALKHLHKSS